MLTLVQDVTDLCLQGEQDSSFKMAAWFLCCIIDALLLALYKKAEFINMIDRIHSRIGGNYKLIMIN